MGSEDTERVRVGGVEFGPLKDALREHEYPVTRTELIEVYGGFELHGPDGGESLEAVLERVDDGRFRRPREVRDALLCGMGEAVGGADGGTDDVSDGGDVDPADDWSRKSV